MQYLSHRMTKSKPFILTFQLTNTVINQSPGEKGRETYQRTHISFKGSDLEPEILSSTVIMLYLTHRPIEKLMFIAHTHDSVEIHSNLKNLFGK